MRSALGVVPFVLRSLRSHPLPLAVVAFALAPSAPAQRIDLPASLKELESRAVRDSNDGAAYYNVALAYWKAKRWDDADSALHRAIRLDPHLAAAYMALAGLPYARRPSLVEEEYERRVPEGWTQRIEASEGHYRHAMLLDPLVELRIGYVMLPTQERFHTSLAVLFGDWVEDYLDGQRLYFEAKYEESWHRFQRVFNELNAGAERHTSRLWNTLLFWHGLASAQTRRWDDALYDFGVLLDRYEDVEQRIRDSTLQVPLRTNEFRYVLGVVAQRAGRPAEAVGLFRKAIENDIGLFTAHARLADIAEADGDLATAVAERRAAIEVNPEDASLVLDLGRTLVRAGRSDEAVAAFREAAELNPRDARPLYYLGVLCQRLNRLAEATDALTRFLAIAPSRFGPQIADATQRLASLR